MNFSKYLPLIPDLSSALNNVRQTYKYQDDFEKVECSKCGGSGYVVITKVIKEGGETYKYHPSDGFGSQQLSCLVKIGDNEILRVLGR